MADNQKQATNNYLRLKLRRLRASSFVRNVATVASGAAGAQVIALALTPVITRLYSPEAFGHLGVFTAAINFLAPAAALTYPIAIVLAENDANARQLVKLSVVIAIVNFLILGLLFHAFQAPMVRLFGLDEISAYIFLIPFVILILAGRQIAEQWLIREHQFKAIAKVTVFHALAINSVQAAMGLVQPTGGTLILTAAAGRLIQTALLAMFAGSPFKCSTKTAETAPGTPLLILARQHWDFPLLRTPEVLVSSASSSVPVVLVAALFGPLAAGYFTLCRTVLSLPTHLIGKSVGDVFYPRIAEAARNGSGIHGLLKKSTLALLGVGILPYSILIVFGPFLFSSIFGDDWRPAGEFVRWISVGSLLHLVNRPTVQAMPVLSAQGLHLLLTVLSLIVRTGGIFIGYFVFESVLASVALYGAADALVNLTRIVLVMRRSRVFDSAHRTVEADSN